ncbi:ABC-three component system middle component 5 [Cereibacter johrii]|uniref:ABC-three component system middle component 5 n=1 Tax=Cereibacter johrii TaxID=445629 RepID=UPI00399F74F6
MFVLFPDENAIHCGLDTARILDFYLCFPSLICEFRSPKDIVKLHNVLKRKYTPNSYQETPRPAVMFRRMSAAQSAASSSLHSYGFFDHDAFTNGRVARTPLAIPERLSVAVREHRRDNSELVAYLDDLKSRSLLGPDGLRARSKLEEFRYDDV